MRVCKLSTARSVTVLMIDSTDHITGKTGLTLTITASKDGAAFASITPTVTELSAGWYKLALTTAHTDTSGDLALHITGTGCDPQDVLMQVVAYDPTSATSLGLTNLDATVSSRLASASYTAPDNATITNIYGVVDTEVGAIKAKTDQLTFTTANKVDSTIQAAADLAQAAADKVWSTAARTVTGGTIGTYTGNTPQTGDAYARLGAPVGASISADVAAVQADTDNLQTRIPAALVSGRIDASVGAMAANVLTATAINADAITDAKVAADVTIASVTGAVGSVTGAVGSVTGNVGGNVTGSVGSVAAGGITATSFGASAIDAAALATDAGQEIADRILTRAIGGGSDAGRTVRQALAAGRNKWEIVAGTLTVYAEDDSTILYTAAVTTTAGNPISAVDP